MAPTNPENIPLRTRKRAQTRIALVEALVERLADQALDDIQVRDLAAAANVSQATFFNYFKNKTSLLVHFVQLWSLRMGALARRVEAERDSALSAIEALFDATAAEVAHNPRLMLEIIAAQARSRPDQQADPVELAERVLFLSDEDRVDELSDGGLWEIVPALLARAVAQKELPAKCDLRALGLAVASVFFGIPLLLGQQDPQAVGSAYRQQLALLWAGARGR